MPSLGQVRKTTAGAALGPTAQCKPAQGSGMQCRHAGGGGGAETLTERNRAWELLYPYLPLAMACNHVSGCSMPYLEGRQERAVHDKKHSGHKAQHTDGQRCCGLHCSAIHRQKNGCGRGREADP